MGARGPQPGAKAAKKASAAVVAAAPALLAKAQPSTDEPAQVVGSMSAADRENPSKLSGQALKDLAHRWGISRSEANSLSDERLRLQMRHITSRRSEED
jgi:hypothetical protein